MVFKILEINTNGSLSFTFANSCTNKKIKINKKDHKNFGLALKLKKQPKKQSDISITYKKKYSL